MRSLSPLTHRDYVTVPVHTMAETQHGPQDPCLGLGEPLSLKTKSFQSSTFSKIITFAGSESRRVLIILAYGQVQKIYEKTRCFKNIKN